MIPSGALYTISFIFEFMFVSVMQIVLHNAISIRVNTYIIQYFVFDIIY